MGFWWTGTVSSSRIAVEKKGCDFWDVGRASFFGVCLQFLQQRTWTVHPHHDDEGSSGRPAEKVVFFVASMQDFLGNKDDKVVSESLIHHASPGDARVQ